MNTKQYAYQTIINTNNGQFDDEIGKQLNEGWELYGNPYAISDERDGVSFHYHAQALIITEENFNKAYVDDKEVTPGVPQL